MLVEFIAIRTWVPIAVHLRRVQRNQSVHKDSKKAHANRALNVWCLRLGRL